jgi:L-ascorbate metabolism protein UlaG (beta-lactamase superfamily)
MRFKLGRPDLERYAGLQDVPVAGAGLSVTFLGVSTLLLDDGASAILTDGFFSRPSLAAVATRRIAPDHARIQAALARAGIRRLDAVVPVHTHYDHALDSPVVAERTGAVLVGGASAPNLGRGYGLPEDRIRVVTSGESVSYGAFELTFVGSTHCPPDRYPGPITEPVVPPARARAYRCGDAWSLLVEHTSGRTALIQGSAGYVRGALAGQRTEVVYLGVGQLGLQSDEYLRTYWAETVETVGARRVVLIHFDDFFRPLDQPLRALPYAGDDLDVTIRTLTALAHDRGVELHLPILWRREDPWRRPDGRT